jgi:hypothetical protein
MVEHPLDKRQQKAKMSAAGHLGHDPAKSLVKRNLAGDALGSYTNSAVDQCHGCFITRGFDAKHEACGTVTGITGK